jgi:hypothetical protein
MPGSCKVRMKKAHWPDTHRNPLKTATIQPSGHRVATLTGIRLPPGGQFSNGIDNAARKRFSRDKTKRSQGNMKITITTRDGENRDCEEARTCNPCGPVNCRTCNPCGPVNCRTCNPCGPVNCRTCNPCGPVNCRTCNPCGPAPPQPPPPPPPSPPPDSEPFQLQPPLS